MKGFVLDSDIEDRSVPVNAKFINNYMIHANGEFVKVYLMLLYYLSDRDRQLSIEGLGDSLEQNEKAVIRALKYWEQMNLLSLKYSDSHDICGITIRSFADSAGEKSTGAIAATKELPDESFAPSRGVTGHEDAAPAKADSVNVTVSAEVPQKKASLAGVSNDEDFSALVVAVQQYTGTTLGRTNTESLAYMYDTLGFPIEVIEYIVEICVKEGHKSIRYMESVAIDWYSRGIKTLEQAKVEGVVCHKDVFTVMKALGLKGRYPSTDEKNTINSWLNDYGVDVNVVAEACRRTIDRLHSADFRYVEGILKDWKKNSVRNLEDVKRLDEAFLDKKAASRQTTQNAAKNTAKTNRFHNCRQRDNSYEDVILDISQY